MAKVCSVKDCKEPYHGHGYCSSHLYSFKRYRDPLAVSKRGYPQRMVNTGLLGEFEKHMLKTKSRATADFYLSMIRRFLRFIGGEKELSRITDATTKAFFNELKGAAVRRQTAMAVGQFLKFSAETKLPALAAKNGELATFEQGWQLEKLEQKRETRDDMLALLGRKLVNHYLYFQSRLQDGGSESIEDLSRMTAECAELIQAHLPLFLSLSAGGRNVHPIIDERVKP